MVGHLPLLTTDFRKYYTCWVMIAPAVHPHHWMVSPSSWITCRDKSDHCTAPGTCFINHPPVPISQTKSRDPQHLRSIYWLKRVVNDRDTLTQNRQIYCLNLQKQFRCIPRPWNCSSGRNSVFSPNQFFERGKGATQEVKSLRKHK